MSFENCAFLYEIQYGLSLSFFFIGVPGCSCFVLNYRDDAMRNNVSSIYSFNCIRTGGQTHRRRTSRYVGFARVKCTTWVVIDGPENQYCRSYALQTIPRKFGDGWKTFMQNAAPAPITDSGAISTCFIRSLREQRCKMSPGYWTDFRDIELSKLCQTLLKPTDIEAETQR